MNSWSIIVISSHKYLHFEFKTLVTKCKSKYRTQNANYIINVLLEINSVIPWYVVSVRRDSVTTSKTLRVEEESKLE